MQCVSSTNYDTNIRLQFILGTYKTFLIFNHPWRTTVPSLVATTFCPYESPMGHPWTFFNFWSNLKFLFVWFYAFLSMTNTSLPVIFSLLFPLCLFKISAKVFHCYVLNPLNPPLSTYVISLIVFLIVAWVAFSRTLMPLPRPCAFCFHFTWKKSLCFMIWPIIPPVYILQVGNNMWFHDLSNCNLNRLHLFLLSHCVLLFFHNFAQLDQQFMSFFPWIYKWPSYVLLVLRWYRICSMMVMDIL